MMIKAFKLMAVVTVVIASALLPAYGGWADATSVHPAAATANSVYTFSDIWETEDLTDIVLFSVVVDNLWSAPAYLIDQPAPGLVKTAASAGLNMSDQRQQPIHDSTDRTSLTLLRTPYVPLDGSRPYGAPIEYCPLLAPIPVGHSAWMSAYVQYFSEGDTVSGRFRVTGPSQGIYTHVSAGEAGIAFVEVIGDNTAPNDIVATVTFDGLDDTGAPLSPITGIATIPGGTQVGTWIPVVIPPIQGTNPPVIPEVYDATNCTIVGGTALDQFRVIIEKTGTKATAPKVFNAEPVPVLTYGSNSIYPYDPSFSGKPRINVDYGGGGFRDFLVTYPGEDYPIFRDGPDPLNAVPPTNYEGLSICPGVSVESIPNPDDGASSTTYDFRVLYVNLANLPPLPWLSPLDDEFGALTNSGVVLYLDLNRVFDLGSEHEAEGYRPHFMKQEVPGSTNYSQGVVYLYRLQPDATPLAASSTGSIGEFPPTPLFGNNYVSLLLGEYHYFYGCSDDSLTFDDEPPSMVLDWQMNYFDWNGMSTMLPSDVPQKQLRSSTPLDPSLARVTLDDQGNLFMPRAIGRRYSAYGDSPKDWQIYVDRYNLIPGIFEGTMFRYQWPSVEHPRVTLELSGVKPDEPSPEFPLVNDQDLSYRDVEGYDRFVGTSVPYRRAVNPTIDQPLMVGGQFAGYGNEGQRAETNGTTGSTVMTFRIKYKQLDNKPPTWVNVYIGDGSKKFLSANQALTPENGGYVGHTMQPAARDWNGTPQVPPFDYSRGVVYEYKTQLAPGAHTYFFMSNDGAATAQFPARMEDWEYGTTVLSDWWLPPHTTGDGSPDMDHYDNNYCPGPYVNHPCELSQWSVSPATGIRGGEFIYRVLYKDADGQRPYSSVIEIETGNLSLPNQGVLRAGMYQEDSSKNTQQDYKDGVWFLYRTSTLESFSMEQGIRHYRFEFTDDWGRQSDKNDMVSGELVKLPGLNNWVDGPTIGTSVPPTLNGGKIESTDGTSNGATIWKLSVKYKDMNNDAPKFVTLYLGEVNQDGTVTWDAGHAMAKEDPTDNVYTDGVDYFFETRMVGAQNPGSYAPSYWYAFEANDGVYHAMFVPATDPNKDIRSDSAGCLIKQDLTTTDFQSFSLDVPAGASGVKPPIVGTIPVGPASTTALIDPVVWRFPQGDMTQPEIVSRDDEYVVRGAVLLPYLCQRLDDVDPAYKPDMSTVDNVYKYENLTGDDYFWNEDNTLSGVYHSDPNDVLYPVISLFDALPAGTDYVWIRYHHTGEYFLDRLAPTGQFDFTDYPQSPADVLRVDYYFASGITTPIAYNTLPILQNPKLTPLIGSSATSFVFSVDYKETEGLNGQAPDFVRVVIDGVPHDMTPTVTGTPSYRTGVTFRYVGKLSSGSHSYHFETSDGVGMITLPAVIVGDNGESTGDIVPFLGPWVNDPPALSAGLADPNPQGATISTEQSVTYSVVISDADNDAPVADNPIVYVDNPTEAPFARRVTSLVPSAGDATKFTGLRVLDTTGVPANYPLGRYDNKLLTFTRGALAGESFHIVGVSSNIITLDPADMADGDLLSEVNRVLDLPLDTAMCTDVLTGVTFTIEGDNSVVELLPDSAEPSKFRTIRVLDEEGQAPAFAADQYAGKLLQFRSGTLQGRVYLIVSNTIDTIKLLTDDLSHDLVAGDTFAIAALKTYKADPLQQSYVDGVRYNITVPQLGVGAHTYHLSAASQMHPPLWVKQLDPCSFGKLTQSIRVRFPASGDSTGPEVVVVPPTGTVPPVLDSPDPSVSPQSGKSSDEYTFYTSYSDGDGDPPRFHDNVLGYVRLVFNDHTFAADMTPDVAENVDDVNWYKTTRAFTCVANGLPEGNHKFHFEGSDGWTVVRWPALVEGADPTANDPVVMVNTLAKLTNIVVSPPSGNTNTTFNISLTYTDANGVGPSAENGREQVWTEIGDTAITIYLTRNLADGDFAAGVTYRGEVTQLPQGDLATAFKAIDNAGELTTVTGPTIHVTENLHAPTLTNVRVYNLSTDPGGAKVNGAAKGRITDEFVYEATYRDQDGDHPFVDQAGVPIEGVELYVDGKLQTVVRKVIGTDYKAGVVFQYEILGSSLQPGMHNYQFKAKDGVTPDSHSVQTSVIQGPAVVVAALSLERAVFDTTTQNWENKDPKVTETVRFSGSLVGSALDPLSGGQKITVTIAKPDSTSETYSATTGDDNTFSLERVPLMNNAWTVTANWAGLTNRYAPVTVKITMNVKGPTRVVATQDMSEPVKSPPAVDMVSMPMVAPNKNVGTLFGIDRTNMMQIVRWDPAESTYLRYGVTSFQPFDAGAATWIYPNPLYPAEAVDQGNLPTAADAGWPVVVSSQYRLLKPFGTIWDQKASCPIVLKAGWNQIGSPYLAPTAIGNATVSAQGQTVTLTQAAAKGWIRDYAWLWDAATQTYKLVHATRPDAQSKTIDPWRGYWIRALVDCTLTLLPPTSISSLSTASAAVGPTVSGTSRMQVLDEPPAAPMATK